LEESISRLGDLRGLHFSPMHASIFPNVSLLWQGGAIRVWHPKCPKLTEAWGWCFVDKAAPEAYKREKALHMLQRHGTSGTWEADDVDNWVQCHSASEGYVARRYPQNLEMGLGDEIDDPHAIHPDIRGRLGKFQSEINQRAFYQRWAEMMDDPSVPAVPDMSRRDACKVSS
jgi:ethylbenzene dioxygenase alpha subunit